MSDWNRERLEDLRSRPVYGRGASALGTVTEVLFEPEQAKGWIAVDTGRAVVILPLDGATVTRGAVYLPLEVEQLDALADRNHAGRPNVERFHARETDSPSR